MRKNTKEIIYKIQEFSFSILLIRLISLVISIYFILNFNNNPIVFGIIILFLGFITLVVTEKKRITATKFGLEFEEYNLLKIFTKKEFIKYRNILDIEFIPSKFSISMFLLNMIIRSGVKSNKESVLKIKLKDGKQVDIQNIGIKVDFENLKKIICQNK